MKVTTGSVERESSRLQLGTEENDRIVKTAMLGVEKSGLMAQWC